MLKAAFLLLHRLRISHVNHWHRKHMDWHQNRFMLFWRNKMAKNAILDLTNFCCTSGFIFRTPTLCYTQLRVKLQLPQQQQKWVKWHSYLDPIAGEFLTNFVRNVQQERNMLAISDYSHIPKLEVIWIMVSRTAHQINNT